MTNPTSEHDAIPLVQPFPPPGLLVANAYRELHIAATGTEAERAPLGDPRLLPRPWDPASCRGTNLRKQVWDWLDAVVIWLNVEYAWDVAGLIPECWPQHPHMVHEIAVLADRRRRAAHAFDSDLLHEWHHSSLPAFTDRMQARIQNYCEEVHQPWPARSRHARHLSPHSAETRHADFTSDVRAAEHQPTLQPRLAVVNLDTGDIIEDPA
jgi:hypothetical protein